MFAALYLYILAASKTANIEWTYPGIFLVLALVSFGLVTRGLIKRKLPGLVIYGYTLGISLLAIYFFHSAIQNMTGSEAWLVYVLLALPYPFLAFSIKDSRYWLPAFVKANKDEVGVNKVVFRSYVKGRVLILILLILLIIFTVWFVATTMR